MQSSFIKGLQEYWFLVVFLGGLIAGWTQIQTRIANLENRFEKIENKVDMTSDNLATVANSVARIEATVDFLKNNIVRGN